MKTRPGFLSGTMKSKHAGLGAYPIFNDSCCQRKDTRCTSETTHRSVIKGKLVGLRNQLESINWESMSLTTDRSGKKAMAALVNVENKIATLAKILTGPYAGYCLFTWLEQGRNVGPKDPLFTEIDSVVKLGDEAMVKANQEQAIQVVPPGVPFTPPSAPSSGPPSSFPNYPPEDFSPPTQRRSKTPLALGLLLLGGIGIFMFLRR